MKHLKVVSLLSLSLLLGACQRTPVTAEKPPVSQGKYWESSAFESPTGRWFIELEGDPLQLGAQSISAQQVTLRQQAQSEGIQYTERMSYQTLFNGMSIQATSEEARRLSRLPGVKAIYPVVEIPRPKVEAQTLTPQMINAVAMTGADYAQNKLGLTGKGIKVGVIDSGIDVDHPAFDKGRRIVAQHDFVGDSYGTVDPSGNPIYDPQPDDIADDCATNGHGTHVAGIIGGNDPTTGFKGVAPDVQFGAYRVFGCDGGTDGDIMLAAMEQAYKDGMQIVNMSIGSPFQFADYPTAKAANQLSRRGVIVLVAMGNDAAYGEFSGGAPGTAEEVITVASVDNAKGPAQVATINPGNKDVGIKIGNSVQPKAGEILSIVKKSGVTPALKDDGCSLKDADGKPTINPFEPNSLTGKAVLIQRGTCNFSEKAENAKKAGAAAVIIYSNNWQWFAPSVGDKQLEIPAFMITRADGLAIDTLIDSGQNPTITFTDREEQFNAPGGGSISNFSSYGPDPELNMKPEVAAPGGNIYSAAPSDSGVNYQFMSGTSMATPHAAGIAALLLQDKPNLTPRSMKKLMMNTANFVPFFLNGKFYNSVPAPVQLQGAGMLDVVAAHHNTVTATPSKLSLGADTLVSQPRKVVVLRNTSSTDKVFKLWHIPALGVEVKDNDILNPLPAPKVFAKVSVNNQDLDSDELSEKGLEITVPAGGEYELNVVVQPPTGAANLSQYGGYLYLERPDGESVERVSVPYIGLVGQYQAVKVFGNVVVDDEVMPFPVLSDPLMGTISPRGATPNKTPDFTFKYQIAHDKDGKIIFDDRGTPISKMDKPGVLFNLAFSARRLTFEAKKVGDEGFKCHIFTDDGVGRNPVNVFPHPSKKKAFYDISWDGKCYNGERDAQGKLIAKDAEAGLYNLVLTAVSPLGDPNNAQHVDVYTSPTIQVIR